jgi:two-component system CheB/CheR fusion protein
MADRQPAQPAPGPERSENPNPAPDAKEAFPIVAVGASAGGLEAFRELLRRLSPDTGIAVVVIQHLAPGHDSILAQLLSRETSMPVNQAEDGTVLLPNQVYVIPPTPA